VPGQEKLKQHRKAFNATKANVKKNAKITPLILSMLANLNISKEPMVNVGLQFIRRQIDNQYWYFIANHSAKGVDQWIPFGVPIKSANCYDPMTGRSEALVVRQQNNQPQVYIQLEPGETIFLRTGDKAMGVADNNCYLQPDGDEVTLQGDWHVEFIGGKPDELPKAYTTAKLATWTEAPDPAAKAFAGTARYTLTFSLPEQTADDWVLDLGEVRESARIRVNGQEAGVLFAVPFHINIGRLLKPGANIVEIEVTNLSANRIRALDRSGAKWKIMRDANIVSMASREFEPSKWPLKPSGLLGPVTLAPMKKIDF